MHMGIIQVCSHVTSTSPIANVSRTVFSSRSSDPQVKKQFSETLLKINCTKKTNLTEVTLTQSDPPG